jgi:hypothetical protein
MSNPERLTAVWRMAVWSMFIGLSPIGFAQTEIPMSTEKGNITLIFNGFAATTLSTRHLNGSLRNDTPFTFKDIMVEMNGYDANDQKLWLCGSPGIGDGGCTFEMYDSLEPGETVKVTPPGEFASMNAVTVARTEWKIKEARYFGSEQEFVEGTN